MTFRPLMGGLVASVWLACQAPFAQKTMTLDHLHPSLAQTVESMADDTVDIAQARQSELNDVALWVADMLVDSGHVDLTFICTCLLYTSPSPRDLSTSRMPSSA